jgi:hypothetical protein
MSGMTVSCTGSGGSSSAPPFEREIYRFTPRRTKALECTWWESSAHDSHYPPKNGSRATGWRIGSGLSIKPVPGGIVMLAEQPVSTAGAWIVVVK